MQFAQLPYYPTKARGSFGVEYFEEGTVVDVRINLMGKLYSEDDYCDASVTGPEFNPLTEKNHYGDVNPY